MTPSERRKAMATCTGCQAEGCSCFHPPHDGKHTAGCERGKDEKEEGTKP